MEEQGISDEQWELMLRGLEMDLLAYGIMTDSMLQAQMVERFYELTNEALQDV